MLDLLNLRFLNHSTASSTFSFCIMLPIAAAQSSQSSCNSLSILPLFLFGIKVEIEVRSVPVWKDKLLVSVNLPAP